MSRPDKTTADAIHQLVRARLAAKAPDRFLKPCARCGNRYDVRAFMKCPNCRETFTGGNMIGKRGPKPRGLAARFWGHVAKGNGCWNWIGAQWARYGCIRRGPANEGMVQAHRVAYELTHGPIPTGLSVLHRCDNGFCVRPDHLFLGTQADNVRDMDAKGRRGNRKLTAEQVRAARVRAAAGETQVSIAQEFGVSAGAISFALRGQTWRHVS